MKYLSIERPGQVVIKDKPSPKPGKNEALLKMLYGGICGSDLSTYRGKMAYASYPRIPGHEFSAEIIEIGDNDKGLKKGDIVTANPYFNCHHCYSCQRGLVNCCEHNETMGVQRDGAFCEYFVMPVDRIYNGKGIDPKHLAAIEPFCIGYHAAKRAGIKPGNKILIIGAGTIGVFAGISAQLLGGEVYISDIAPEKLEYAKRNFHFKGTILNQNQKDFMAQVQETTSGNGFDVTMEAVGLPSTFQDCIDACAYGGRMVQIGVGKKNLDFNFTLIQKKELNIFGSRNARAEDFLQLIDFVKDKRVDIDKVITNVYDFQDAPKAFSDFDQNAGSMLKVVIKF